MHIRADIRVVLGPGLDVLDPEVRTDLLHLLLHPARGRGHREEERFFRGGEVALGEEDVGIIARPPGGTRRRSGA